jgi:hypothetical protein
MVVKLNTDIIELIIDQFEAATYHLSARNVIIDEVGTSALQSCALTCSALRPRAQYRLFAVIVVKMYMNASALVDVLLKRPDLARSTRVLLVDSGYVSSQQPNTSLWIFYNPSPISLESLLALFTNVSTLILQNAVFADPSAQGIQVELLARAMPSSVRELSFKGCSFSEHSALVGIIRSVTELFALAVEHSSWPGRSPPSSLFGTSIAPKTLIVIPNHGNTEAARPWMQILSFSSLTELETTMWANNPRDFSRWQTIFASAPLLRKLSLPNFRIQAACLDLSCLRHLEILRVGADHLWNYNDDGVMTDDLMVPFLTLLSSTRSVKLHLAEIVFDSDLYYRFDMVNWINFGHVFASVTWANGPNLVITISLEAYEGPLRWHAGEMGADWMHINIESDAI